MFYILVLCSLKLTAQEGRGDLRFVFYNVENLFDPFDDSLCQDEEYLPWGMKHWTWERFTRKEIMICKVLAGTGGWQAPELIGLCEVENRFVLDWLVHKTPLLKYQYRVIHRDSPDPRGIDLALLYLPAVFRPLSVASVRVGGLAEPGRDLLYVKGLVQNRDTLHLILNHWPSRWRGMLETREERMIAAIRARRLFDSICMASPAARILLAGDLNDEAHDESILNGLSVRQLFDDFRLDARPAMEVDHGMLPRQAGIRPCDLYETAPPERKGKGSTSGTLKYRGRWYTYDQLFVSGQLFLDTMLYVYPGSKVIHAPDYLFQEDPVWLGKRPWRSHHGYQYLGGFSDHLPVYIDFYRRDPKSVEAK